MQPTKPLSKSGSPGRAPRKLTSLPMVCFCLLSCGLWGCEKPKPAATEAKDATKNQEPLKAEIVTVSPRTWPTIIRSQGSLVADDQTVVGSRVAGLVRETLVDIGDEVQPGQLLVSLDDSEFQLQLAAAEAALLQSRALIGLKPGDPLSKLDPLNAPPVRESRATLEETRNRRIRWEQLKGQNAVTEEEMQALLAAEKVAEARYGSSLNGVNSNIAQVAVRTADVDLANQKIRDSQIKSPFAGFVQQRSVAKGTFVQVGTPLVTIVRLDSLRFRGTVPERLATALSIGQAVTLSIESIDRPIECKVTRISPALDMASRSLAFEALVDNRQGKLRAGLFAEADIVVNPSATALVVEASSLLEFAGSQKVWKVSEGIAKEQVVRPGRRADGLIEIADGLKAGDKILVTAAIGRAGKIEDVAASPKSSPKSELPASEASPRAKEESIAKDGKAVGGKEKTNEIVPEPVPASPKKDVAKPNKPTEGGESSTSQTAG